MAWKLAAIARGEADEALLETYQVEREPHARALIERAIHMGRVVCTADPAAAAARDAGMIAAREAGAAPPLPEAPDFTAGCLMGGAPGAGVLFPQPWAKAEGRTLKLDDVLGDGAWLISREPAGATPSMIKRFSLDEDHMAPFRSAICGWLDKRGVDAVLVRPDRYVFGAGKAAELVDAFAARMDGRSA